ncbi:hypothetical protein ACHWQZ_G015026 [Mnemiopsis leidyi]
MAAITNSPIDNMEKNLELLFFKEQLRLVVRSNRSRTNSWRKEGGREKDKRNFRNSYENRFKVHRYKWDQSTVLELPTIHEDNIHKSKLWASPARVTRSQPSSQEEAKLPRLSVTAGDSRDKSCFTALPDRCTYKTWDFEPVQTLRDAEPSAAPDMSLSLFRVTKTFDVRHIAT